MNSEVAMALAMSSKEMGNDHFKNQRYVEALECYSRALEECPHDHECSVVFLKNRAACSLKLKRYTSALEDCTRALKICPTDVKSLYRRALAYEKSGNLSAAYADVKCLLSIEPHNKQATELAQVLTISIKKQHETLQSTEGLVKEMFRALNDPKLPQSKVITVAKNCAILSRENSGVEKLYQDGALDVLLPLLDSESSEVVHHILQALAGFCTGNNSRACAVIEKISLNRLSTLIRGDSLEVSCSAIDVMKQTLLSFCNEDSASPDSAIMSLFVEAVFSLLLDQTITSIPRDRIIEMLISTLSKGHFFASVYIKAGLVSKLLQLSALFEGEDTIDVSGECRANISVVLSTFYKNCTSEEKAMMEEECNSYVSAHLSMDEPSSKLEAINAVATLLHGVLDIGAKIFTQSTVLDKVLQVASSDNVVSQSMAAEVLALAASNKERCHGIMKDGLPILKQLFSSPDDRVKVRALVGLCKLGCVGGSNVNARPFAEGSGLKLERACSKFLLSTEHCDRLYKWAVEGLAFLSLDAEVKESVVSKPKVISALCKIPSTGEHSLLYGVATIFVNLTNSYDKPEKNPELEELGKYAGENMPKEHELDGKKYVKKRASSLLKQGIVSGLLALSAVESNPIHEQIARVFLALVEETTHRGVVLQQGGVKALLLLTTVNTVKGKLFAAQALAKMCITNNPKLAFPGQRSLEVVRPLVQLLKSEQGLQQFEALMALTNLASTSDDVRKRIIKEQGIHLMESMMFEEHDLIRRASTEALCNMIQMPQVHERFLNDDVERVKLWTLFSGEEDFELARAASGGLAQLTHDPRICTKVMQVKSATTILKELLANEKEELQYRGTYIVANLIEADQHIAQALIASDFLEILQALNQSADTSQSVKENTARALKKAVEYHLIQPNPELENA